MGRRSRHARSNTWFALKAAHAQTIQELAAERYARFADQLEASRLTGLVEELTEQRDRATHELVVVRGQLQVARGMRARTDPNVQTLALEASELRATIADQHLALAHLAGHLVDLLERNLPPRPTPTSRLEPVAVPGAPPDSPSAPGQGRSPAPVHGGMRAGPAAVDEVPEHHGAAWLGLAEQTTDA